MSEQSDEFDHTNPCEPRCHAFGIGCPCSTQPPREDVTPSGVAALRMAAGNMPLSRPGQPWEGAAEWLHSRADAIEKHVSPPATPWCDCGLRPEHLHDEDGVPYDPRMSTPPGQTAATGGDGR